MTNPVSFIFEGVPVEFLALQLGLGELAELTQGNMATVEVAETAQELLTFITTTRANPFHNQRVLQQELSRLAQDPKIARVLMQARNLIHQGNWHPSTKKRFAEYPDLSFLAKRKSPVRLSAEASITGSGRSAPGNVAKPPVKTPPAETLILSPPKTPASLWERLTDALGRFVGRTGEAREATKAVPIPAQATAVPERDAWIVPSSEDRVQGSIVGGAVADTLGKVAEPLTKTQILFRYGPKGIQDFEPASPQIGINYPAEFFTDDTQLTIAVAEGLLASNAGLTSNVIQEQARQFVKWFRSPENNRPIGRACIAGCEKLERNVVWYAAGGLLQKGSGTAMRAAPYGIVYGMDWKTLDEVAGASALMTHRHPTAQAASIVAARLVAFALHSPNPEHFKAHAVDTVLAGLPINAREVVNALRKIPSLPHHDPDTAFKAIGDGWVAEEVLAGALYAVLSTDNYKDTVLRAVNTDGDSDTIGAIAGNIAGALYGFRAIPETWRTRVEKSADLIQLGARLAGLSTRWASTPHNEASLIHNPKWVQFPEIRRALYDPETALELFGMHIRNTLNGVEGAYGQDVWLDTQMRLGKGYLSRQEMDQLVREQKAHETEFVPLDSYIGLMQLHEQLLRDPNLSIYVRLAAGIVASPVADSYLTDWDYVMELTHYSETKDAADFERRITEKYPLWRTRILTQEWAEERLQQHKPEWLNELKTHLNGLSREGVPQDWAMDYGHFVSVHEGFFTPYLRAFDWPWPIIEWYFVAHAKFLEAQLQKTLRDVQ